MSRTNGTISAKGAISSDVGISSGTSLAATTSVTGATVVATTSATIGSGTAITKIVKSTIAVTISALAAAAEEDIDVAVTGAAVGDSVIVTPLEATMETGVAVLGAWVLSAGNITIRVGNTHTSSLTGSTSNWQCLLIRS